MPYDGCLIMVAWGYDMLDKFPSVLAATTFLILSLSVVHEWGYYSELGARFQTLVSAADYLSTALLWLPYIAIGWLVSALLSLLQLRTGTLSHSRATFGFHFIGAVSFLLSLFAFFFLPPWLAWLAYISFLGGYLWIMLYRYVTDHHYIRPLVNRPALYIGAIAPIAVALAYFTGVNSAIIDLSTKEQISELVVKGGDEQPHIVVLLRLLDKGPLVREGFQVEFYDWREIVSVRSLVMPSNQSHSCRIFQILCNWTMLRGL